MWSDPSSHTNNKFEENPRGFGYLFSCESVYDFLKRNSLKRIIRAHQCVHKGCLANFEDKCITVFSVSSYGKYQGNCSAVVHVYENDEKIESTTFLPIRHLQKNEVNYYKVQEFNHKEKNVKKCFSLTHPILNSNSPTSCLIKNYVQSNKRILNPTKSTNISGIPLVKPKFITDSRKSYSCSNKKMLLEPIQKEEQNDETYIIDENNRKYNISNSVS